MATVGLRNTLEPDPADTGVGKHRIMSPMARRSFNQEAKTNVGTPKKVLSIAGSDSGGGAGLQADLKTCSALGCYGMTAVTALTAQNTLGVTDIHAPPASFLKAQLDAVMGDLGADAVKIGMLHSEEIVAVVADCLRAHPLVPVVLDPVMVATSGDTLTTPNTQEAITRLLFPLATLITPNLDELSLLVGRTIDRPHQFEEAARQLMAMGARSVLVKGGHLLGSTLIDLLVEPDQVTEIASERVATRNLHGTGCTLSSAIACFLAQGYSLRQAVRGGHDYVLRAIQAGKDMTLGQGHGPVNHSFSPLPMHITGAHHGR